MKGRTSQPSMENILPGCNDGQGRPYWTLIKARLLAKEKEKEGKCSHFGKPCVPLVNDSVQLESGPTSTSGGVEALSLTFAKISPLSWSPPVNAPSSEKRRSGILIFMESSSSMYFWTRGARGLYQDVNIVSSRFMESWGWHYPFSSVALRMEISALGCET